MLRRIPPRLLRSCHRRQHHQLQQRQQIERGDSGPLPLLSRRDPCCRTRRALGTSSSLRRSPGQASPVVDEGAALLRKMSRYMEEDPKLAEAMGRALNPEARISIENLLRATTFEVKQPSEVAIRRVVISNAVPFVGFGFMDNAIMILAGETIDMTLGVSLGISTMAAAALGNLVSDVLGVGLGGVTERLAAKLGMPSPGLTHGQMKLPAVRSAAHVGMAIGVSIGCVLGMLPLLFLPDHEKLEEEKKIRRTQTAALKAAAGKGERGSS